MKIILIRHAKVDVNIYTLTYASELKKYLTLYNNASIQKEFCNENNIRKILNNSDKIFCSQLKRSIASVELYEKKPNLCDAIFNEAGLPFSDWRGVKLPLVVWSMLFRIMWFFGYAHNGESLAKAKGRATKGAEKLMNSFEEASTVTLLGHGLMNRLIAKELLRQGWKSSAKMGTDNWDYGVFELNA